MGAIYRIWNGAAPTTASQVAVDTGTAIKTMLQVKGIAGKLLNVKAWGVSMDGAAAAAGVEWELIETGTVFATVTAHVAAGIVAVNSEALDTASTIHFAVGTAATGFTSTVEGTITASRVLDGAFVQPTGERSWEFSLGNGRVISAVSALRLRCKAAAAVDALCWVEIEV